MYHAEVKLIKPVWPVDEVERAPWPKLQVRCSFELRYVESRCEKAWRLAKNAKAARFT